MKILSYKKFLNENIKNTDGIDYIFDFWCPELSKIGNKRQYSTYINTIFPKSITHGLILYRNTFEEYLNIKHGQYFTNNRLVAEETYKQNYTHPVLLNLIYPKLLNFDETQNINYKEILKSGFDGTYTKNLSSDIGISDDYKEYTITSPNQVYLLGDDNDIEKFNSFLNE